MDGFSRRNFVVPMLGTAALASSSPGADPVIVPPPQVSLGRTGITMSRLGFGTGVKAAKKKSAMTRQGFEAFVNLFRHCYDRGITFFDLADWYGSHPYCREALRYIPREKVSIMTKLWWRSDGNKPGELSVAHRSRSAKVAVDRFRHELQTDYLDMVLLHCLVQKEWVGEMQPYMDVLSEEKAAGRIKALGVSCHNFGAMQTAAELPWVDVMLARLNPFGVMCDSTPEEVQALLKKAKANGKSIIGMKIYGEGKLVDKRDECMQYAQSNGVFDAMTIGAVSPEQVDENLALMAEYPVV
ncbi:aldo/keto reductase [Pontiellaceae bacterium B12227]|nr:aldo/keto reductase [Pontiellaceae bacterium B12227]